MGGTNQLNMLRGADLSCSVWGVASSNSSTPTNNNARDDRDAIFFFACGAEISLHPATLRPVREQREHTRWPPPASTPPQSVALHLDTAFSVQNIVEELHYQHSAEAVRTVLNDMSGRAEPFVEQRDEGGSDDYYLKRGGGGGAEGGGDGAEE